MYLGDLGGWIKWLADEPDGYHLETVGRWIQGLVHASWQAPSVPVNDPPYGIELRTAVFPIAGHVAVDYRVNHDTGQIDIPLLNPRHVGYRAHP